MTTTESNTATTTVTRKIMGKELEIGPKVQLPKNAYVLQIIDEEFAPSKNSGNDMITLTCQIVSPDKVENAAGDIINCGGYEFKTYFPLQNSDPKILDMFFENLFSLWEKLGHKLDSFDAKNPPLYFKQAISEGKPLNMDVVLYGKKQSLKGPDGKIVTIGGKPVIDYQVQIDGWYGISTVEIANAGSQSY